MNSSTFRALRPHQWAKNFLVFAAPAGAGLLTDGDALWSAVVAFVAFCAASSAGYLANDVIDREHDRRHPSKAHRPIAAGALHARDAALLSFALAAFSLAASAAVRVELSAVIGAYLVLTFAYSAALKRVPWLELGLLAMAFVLRAIGGAVAVDVTSSGWFITVVSAVGVFVVARKRWCEQRYSGPVTRPVLAHYSPVALDVVGWLAAGVAIVAHTGWALDVSGNAVGRAVATVAFAGAVVRYAQVTASDDAGGDPVIVMAHDRILLGLGVVWVVAFVLTAGS